MFALIRKAAVFAACVAAVALVFAACGGGTSTSSTPTSSVDAPCTNDATATAAAAAQGYHEGTAVPFVAADDEAHCRLRRALLTTGDLPAGWTERQFQVGPAVAAAGGQLDCGVRAPASGIVVTVMLIDTDGHFGGGQWIFAFNSGGAADLVRAVKQKCADLAATEPDSSTDYRTIDLPSFGDESFGVHGLPSLASVYIRRGDLVTLLTVGTKGASDAELSQLAAKADAKLAKVGPIPTPNRAPSSAPTAVSP